MKKIIFSISVLMMTIFAQPTWASFHAPDKKISDISGKHLQTCSTQDGHVYTVWYDETFRAPNLYDYNILFNFSADRGYTWQSSPIPIESLVGILLGGINIDPEIDCTEGGHVYLTWQEDPGSNNSVCFKHSSDYGLSWNPVVWFMTQEYNPGPNILSPHVSSTEDGHVYLVWQDPRAELITTAKDIFFNRSDDYGSTWQPTNTMLNMWPSDANDVVMESTEDGHVYLVWADDRNQDLYSFPYADQNIYTNMSSDYGATWEGIDWQIDGNWKPFGHSHSPSIGKTEAGDIYVAWVDGWDIYFSSNPNYGFMFDWQPEQRLDLGTATQSSSSSNPQVGNTTDGHIYVVWQDVRNGASDIYLNYSSDSGISWQTPDIRVDLGDTAGQNDSLNPVISNDETGNVYVAFEDTRNGGSDILFNQSTDFGATWGATPFRVNTGSTIGTGQGFNPVISSDASNHIYIAWEDSRVAVPGAGIYFNYWTQPLTGIPTLSDYMMLILALALFCMLLIIARGRVRRNRRQA